MYDKFQNGVYVTSFSAEDVYKDFVDFFSERNLGNIHNVKYIEGINKTRGNYAEDKENYIHLETANANSPFNDEFYIYSNDISIKTK